MNRKYIIITAVVAAILIVSAAFAYIYYQGQTATSQDLQGLVDDHGFTTSLAAYPNRIISLAPSNTEILFALGLDNKVVAVTDYVTTLIISQRG